MLEADIRPDLLVGTSAGAINATFLALNGFHAAAIDRLEDAWRTASHLNLLPSHVIWLTRRVLLNRLRAYPYHRLRDFFISQGLTPDLRFGDLPGPPVVLVSADLNTYQPVFYGPDPRQSVLEGVLASTALPPWVHPIEIGGHFLMDGGVVSNLPIEPALRHGATEIIALGLSNPAAVDTEAYGFGPFWAKLLTTIEERQIALEMELARARNVPVHRVDLKMKPAVPIWDFSHTDEMFLVGYRQTQAALQTWQREARPPENRLIRLWKRLVGAR